MSEFFSVSFANPRKIALVGFLIVLKDLVEFGTYQYNTMLLSLIVTRSPF